MELAIKVRRDKPSFFARSAPISPIRCSTCFCLVVCRLGMNSSFDTTCVGIGESTPFFTSRSPFGIHIASLPFKDEPNADRQPAKKNQVQHRSKQSAKNN